MNVEELTPAQARKLLSRIVASGDISFSKHAIQELSNDGMTTEDALKVLRWGHIHEPAEMPRDTWRYRVHTTDACVVIEFDSETLALVITAWRKK